MRYMEDQPRPFTKDQIRSLQEIHRRVMRRFTYATDREQFGKTEHWDDESVIQKAASHGIHLSGDCEETARVWMRLARDLGMKARLVIGYDETGEGHCWCEVASDDMSQAIHMDNRRTGPVGWSQQKGYRAHSASPWNPESGDTRPWLRLMQPYAYN